MSAKIGELFLSLGVQTVIILTSLSLVLVGAMEPLCGGFLEDFWLAEREYSEYKLANNLVDIYRAEGSWV